MHWSYAVLLCALLLPLAAAQSDADALEQERDTDQTLDALEPAGHDDTVRAQGDGADLRSLDRRDDARAPRVVRASVGERRERLDRLSEQQRERLGALEPALRARLASLNDDQLATIAELSDEELRKLAAAHGARIAELAQENPQALRERLANARIITKTREEALRAREVSEQRRERALQAIEQAQQLRSQARDRMGKADDEFDQARERLRACENDSNECDALAEEVFEHAKQVLLAAIDRIDAQLTMIAERAAQNDDLSEEQAQAIIEDVEAAQQELTSIRSAVEQATTKQELFDARDDLRELWNEAHSRAKHHIARLVHAGTGEVIVRADQLEKRLDAILETLANAGTDTEQVDAKVSEFSSLIADAYEAHAAARDAYNDAIANDEPIAEAKQLEQQAHQLLREAHAVLVEIRQLLGERARDLSIPDEVEVVEFPRTETLADVPPPNYRRPEVADAAPGDACETDDDCGPLKRCGDGSTYRSMVCADGVCDMVMFAGGSPCFDESDPDPNDDLPTPVQINPQAQGGEGADEEVSI